MHMLALYVVCWVYERYGSDVNGKSHALAEPIVPLMVHNTEMQDFISVL